MCGCEAHHTKGAPCTCICRPSYHADPADVALQQQMPVWSARFRALADEIGEEEPVAPWWARLLGLDFHSDDDSILVRHLYGNQRNLPEGRYVSDEVILSFTSWSLALGIEYENQEIDPRREVWWRGLTLRFGPFSLTASRDKGKL